MTKAEINEKLKELLANQSINKSISTEVENLLVEYAQLEKESQEFQLQKFVNDGGDSVEFSYSKDEFDEEFYNLKGLYKQRIQEAKDARTKDRELALNQKQELVTQLSKIIKTDVKNLGNHFKIAKDIQEQWKATGHFPGEDFHELETAFKAGLDEFYYNSQIIKDAIELDYQKNFEEKKRVIEKLQSLINETDVRKLERKISQYEKEWFRIGPVKRDIRDESKQELEDTIASLQPTLDKLYENQEELLKENLNAKIKLCEQLNEILEQEKKTPKQFQTAADKVVQLQNQWKEIGRSEENDRIWEVFKGSCDMFFNNKRDFFKHLAENRKENKNAKQELIDKAEQAKDSKDWKKTSIFFIDLQKQWKKIGPAHPAEDQKLWLTFRAQCDHFFNARKEHYKEQDKEFEENLKLKQLIIEQLNQFKLSGNPAQDIQQLRDFEKQYQAIGFVPFKQKDNIHNAFFDPLNAFYKELNVEKQSKTKMRFESRIKSMAQGKKPDKTLHFEENKIRQQMQEINQKLAQYENNFNISDSSNPLAKSLQKTIKDMKREYKNLELQLQLIRDAKAGKFDEEE